MSYTPQASGVTYAGQSRRWSAFEAVANVAIGYGVAVCAQIVIFPWFGLHPQAHEHLLIGLAFTVVSLVRSYVLRRVFNMVKR